MSTKQPSFIKSPDSITITFVNGSGDTATIYSSDPRWDDINAAVREQRWEDAYDIAFPAQVVENWLNNYSVTDRVTIDAGVVYVNKQPMHNTLTTRMLEMLTDGFDIEPMALFLDNLMDNPSFRAVNELYDFLEASKLPITEDGHFLAYKRVRNNYTDCHSGKFDNSVGAVCEMPRNMVDEDKDRTCSRGLHFCGREYLKFYGTGPSHRSMVVKINPADVVAIPSDHDNMKGRASRYIVVDELEHSNETELEGAFRRSMPDYDIPGEDTYDIFEEEDNAVYDTIADIVSSHPNAVLQLRSGKTDPGAKHISPKARMVDWFESPREAFDVTGIHNIAAVANGIRQTAGGYEWVWARDVDAIGFDLASSTAPTGSAEDTSSKTTHTPGGVWLQNLLRGNF